ncbi:MAG: HAD-IIA family hydrolase [Lentisphaeria bacterium]|nr:HAD-IIA family hydrolase [Lentisphaeria bacterium]
MMAETLLELYRKNPEKFRAFLFDIDGTVLLANTPIPGAPEFLDVLRKDHVPFFFLTNNCAQTHEEIAQRLTDAGIYAKPDEIISSGDPVPKYFMKKNKTGKAWKYFLVGRTPEIPGVIEYEKDPAKIMECDGVLHNAGKYDWAVVMTAILNFFLKFPEKPFIVTNPDMLNPMPRGVTLCSNGQMELIIALLKKQGIDKERIHFGKPFPAVYEEVKERLASVGVKPEEALAVGDWLNSDIRGANLAGISSCLVLTGLSKEEDIANHDETFCPEFIVSTLS